MTTEQQNQPQLSDFEQGAIMVRSTDGALLRVTSRDGVRILWRAGDAMPSSAISIQPPEPELPSVENREDTEDTTVHASIAMPQAAKRQAKPDKPAKPGGRALVGSEQVQEMVRRRLAGQPPSIIARDLELSVSTVERHLREQQREYPHLQSGRKPAMPSSAISIQPPEPELPSVENRGNARILPSAAQTAIKLALASTGRMSILGKDPILASYFEGYLAGMENGLALLSAATGFDLGFLEEDDGN